MIQNIKHRIPAPLKNKYVLTLIVFFFWMMIFDQNNIINQIELKRELNRLENERERYQEQIQITKSELENLLNDNEKLETYAREKYLMKKPDEDIFVIVRED